MRIGVAMSGGMDSTAVALILKRRGCQVIGFHMCIHDRSSKTWELAQAVAKQIDVEIQKVELTQEFSEKIIKPFIREYLQGRTPSPCPLCNREMKMSSLAKVAQEFGCEKFATGHYARICYGPNGPQLFRGKDAIKDQSYFLFALSREMLQQMILPLGDMTKNEVRELLRAENISAWETPESQELCFIPDRNYKEFLLRHGVTSSPGNIVDTEGTILGTHSGIIGFTVGQRRGLRICRPTPMYVIRINPETREVVVGPKEQTFTKSLKVRDINLLTSREPRPGDKFQVKVRSNAKPVDCEVVEFNQKHCVFEFDKPQSSVAPGQAAVLYSGERLIAGGWID